MAHSYGQFCPVAKAAEIFAERWTPLLIRELLVSPMTFGELKNNLALMSRSVLSTRLKELEASGIVEAEAKSVGNGKTYRLTPAGEGFRDVVNHLSLWGQNFGQDRVGPSDVNPTALLWAMKTHGLGLPLPESPFVVEFELRGIPRGQTQRRRWWLLLRQPEMEVCLKWPGHETNVLVKADLGALTRAWLGYLGCREAEARALIAFDGEPASIRRCKSLLGFADQPHRRHFAFEPMFAAA